MAFAIGAREASLTSANAIVMSAVVNSGVTQIASVALFVSGADLATVVIAAALINLRYAVCAASLAPLLDGVGRPLRAVLAFGLSDASYCLSIAKLQAREPRSVPYFLGAGLGSYLSWVFFTMVGVPLERLFVDSRAVGLHLLLPLSLMALLRPMVQSRSDVVSALGAAAVVLTIRSLLQVDMALVVAAMCGCMLGAWFEARP